MRIRNWDKFQHYKRMHSKYKKQMTWLKLYGGDILNDMEWYELSDTNKAIYIELLCLASQHEGNLPDINKISFRLRRPVEQVNTAMQELSHWIEQGVYTAYIPEEEKEEEKEQTKKVVRYDYSLFNKFWDEVIPTTRKYAKDKCKDKWKSHDLNKEAEKIFSWYESMKKTEEWKKGMIPAPEVVINQRRWEATVSQQQKVKEIWEGGI